MSKGRVVVVGSLNIDLVTRVTRHPVPGETVTGHGLELLPGGKGANQAVAAARAGALTSLVGRVGADSDGSAYLLGLRRQGVDVGLVQRTPGRPSGHALVLVDDKGENSIVVVAGANEALSPQDVQDAAAVVRAADVLVLQLEIPLPVAVAAATLAHAAGRTVMLNPSPVQPLPAELLEAVDVVVANELEADRIGEFGGSVVTTLGDRGAVWRAPGGRTWNASRAAKSVVDTTGAGDAFAGTLAAALAGGATEQEALEAAVAAGAAAVGWQGAQGWSLAD